MKMIVTCGSIYEKEVDATSFDDAITKAFALALPLAIGEVMAVRIFDGKRKAGTVYYALTSGILEKHNLRVCYQQIKRKFRLKTNSPFVEKVKGEPGS